LSFTPLQRATRGRLLALVVVGLLIWLATIVVVGIAVHRSNDVEIGLGVTGVAFLVALLGALPMRARRVRAERAS
jgi:hypothetical protein